MTPPNRRNEPLFRVLFDNSLDAVALVSADGTGLYASPSNTRVLGYALEEIVGVNAFTRVHPDDMQGVQERFVDLLRTPGASTTHTFRFLHKDGGYRWMETVATNLLAEPEVEAIVLNYRDVTERRQAEGDLRYVMTHARCILWHALVSARDNPANPYRWELRAFDEEAAQRFLPVRREPGQHYMRALNFSKYPEDRLRMDENFRAALRAGKSHYRQEFRCLRADGDLRLLHEEATIEPLGEGRWRLAGVITDVTEARRAEAARQETEARYRRIVDTAAEGIYTLDAEGRVAFVNERLSRMLGYRAGEMLGRHGSEFILEADRQASQEFIERRSTGEAAPDEQKELRLRRADGTPLWVLLSATAIFDEAGRFAGVLGLATDLTDRKGLERALEARAAELVEADRRKDEFLAMLAHELRNPLAPILNAVEIMRTRSDREVGERAREVISRQARHMGRMVDDLMDVARISRGSVSLRREPMDLARLARETVETCRPFVGARRHALTVSLPEGPVLVDGDPARLEQVLTNLLTNAAKYTEPGGDIRVTLEVPAEPSPGQALLRVRDTGIGIPPAMLSRVFETFAQVESSRPRSEGGLGLGLALVRSLVELHDGTVTAHSAGAGKGSEFVVRLPVMVSRGAHQPATADPGVKLQTPKSKRVLVVDDNPDATATLADLLPLWECDVRVAHDGPAALEQAADFIPEVVLLDLALPGMDGYEVARLLRARENGETPRLIAVTGYGQAEDRERAHAAGFDLFLTKPVDPEILRRVLDGAC